MSPRFDRSRLRTWIDVDIRALRRNLGVFREIVPRRCGIMAIAKSNAYGHGLYDLAPALEKMRVDWFGVDSIVEAVTLRKKGVKRPILVLGYTLPSRYDEALGHRLSLTVSSFPALRAAAAAPGLDKIGLHLKIDTGMHRQGFLPGEIAEVLDFLRGRGKKLTIEGIYTHFAAAKDPAARTYTEGQIALFECAAAAFREAGFTPLLHAGATAGAINYPEAHYDLVRVGIGLMGLWPSDATRAAAEPRGIALRPALAWHTIVSEIKNLPRGAKIGYDLTAAAARDSRIGICPIGYWHGFPRSLSNIGEVLVRGRRVKILGVISMDMTVVDLTDVPEARVGDTATVIGPNGGQVLEAAEVARTAGVTRYEFLTRLNPLIQKFYRG